MTTEPAAKGMLFKAEMVTALLNTEVDVWPAKAADPSKPMKWQTRREIKLGAKDTSSAVVSGVGGNGFIVEYWPKCAREFSNFGRVSDLQCPHPIGTLIYAKETFHVAKGAQRWKDGTILYRADHGTDIGGPYVDCARWKPSIFMPRAAARIWLRVMNVRVERVQDIGKDGRRASDVLAEGISTEQIAHWQKYLHADDAPAHTYGALWESINGKGSWARNPWVWVYHLARITKP